MKYLWKNNFYLFGTGIADVKVTGVTFEGTLLIKEN